VAIALTVIPSVVCLIPSMPASTIDPPDALRAN
jgi:hypothetical protein